MTWGKSADLVCQMTIPRVFWMWRKMAVKKKEFKFEPVLVLIVISAWNSTWHRVQFSSVQFSCSVVSNSLRPHELQHARLPCPSPTLEIHSDSRPSSQWCHPAISSSVVPFSSCPQSLPASESFPMSQLFAWGGQNTGVSASASVLPMNSQDWFPLGLTGLSSLQSKGLSIPACHWVAELGFKPEFLDLWFERYSFWGMLVEQKTLGTTLPPDLKSSLLFPSISQGGINGKNSFTLLGGAQFVY